MQLGCPMDYFSIDHDYVNWLLDCLCQNGSMPPGRESTGIDSSSIFTVQNLCDAATDLATQQQAVRTANALDDLAFCFNKNNNAARISCFFAEFDLHTCSSKGV
jgi:hypothetical protein